MVHRPGDTQLLAQLIKHEKDYAAAFQALTVAAASSRDSLSAYAAASPAHIARPIAVLVAALGAADDALTGYRESFEEWREHLHRLKELEDELAVVLRDRQILINRVIKVSKSPRPAAGASSQPSSGSLDAKIGQAQAELRACEAYLVDKEREHETAWARAMRDGLRARCKALVDYGWQCAERGKDALHALDDAASTPHPQPPPPPHNFFKPLPDPRNGSHIILPAPGPGSDNSSLTPSQSASQTDHGASLSRSSSLSRPPPDGLPTSSYQQPHPVLTAPSLNRPIVEEPEQAGSSSEEEPASGTLRMVENHPRQSVLSLQSGTRPPPPPAIPPAAQSHTSLRRTARRASQQQTPNGVVPFPHPGPAPTIPRAPSWSSAGSGEKGRRRATSFSFFGSISSMFSAGRGGHKREPSPSKGAWASRTDSRLRRRTDSSSDDERAKWASDGGGPTTLTRAVSRSGSVRSRKNSEEPSKTYIRANKAAAGGFAFSRTPSVSKKNKANANAVSGSPRSSSDVGPSTIASSARRAERPASLRRNVLEGNHGPSLMSIVEGTQSRNGTLRRDGSVSKRRESVQVVASSLPRQQAQEQERGREATYEPPPVRHEPVTREAEARMGPLRSALRNGANRSPSPGSVELPVTRSYASDPAPSSPPAGPSTLPVPTAPEATDTDSDADSFETGHETLLGDAPMSPPSPTVQQGPRAASPPPRAASPQPPAPTQIRAPSPLPALPPKPYLRDGGPGSSSSSTVSNSAATITMGTVSSTGTARRKSVRMVLPPDFAGTPLPTPTAEVHLGGAGGWQTRASANGHRDAWDDSSEDDGEYQRARMALAQADQKLSKAGEPEHPANSRKTRTRRY